MMPQRRGAHGPLDFIVAVRKMKSLSRAEVAELADAHDSGSCARKGVGVRVPPSAPRKIKYFLDRLCRLQKALFFVLSASLVAGRSVLAISFRRWAGLRCASRCLAPGRILGASAWPFASSPPGL